jgi:hypothetical protein
MRRGATAGDTGGAAAGATLVKPSGRIAVNRAMRDPRGRSVGSTLDHAHLSCITLSHIVCVPSPLGLAQTTPTLCHPPLLPFSTLHISLHAQPNPTHPDSSFTRPPPHHAATPSHAHSLSPGADDLDAADFIDIAMRARDEERGAGVSGREAGSSVSEGGPLLEATPSSHGLDGASPPHGGAAPGHGDPAHNGCVPAGDDGSSTVGSDASPAGTCGVLSSSPHETELVALLVPLPTPPVLSVLRAFYWATSQVAELAQAARGMLASSASPLSDADIAAAIELASPFRHAPADEARAAVAGAEAGLERCRRVEAELASQEALAAAGAYGEEGEWWALHGRCFKHTEGESRYSVCPFRYLKQEGRLVGNFSGWGAGDGGAAERGLLARLEATGGETTEVGWEMRCGAPSTSACLLSPFLNPLYPRTQASCLLPQAPCTHSARHSLLRLRLMLASCPLTPLPIPPHACMHLSPPLPRAAGSPTATRARVASVAPAR